MAITKAKTIDEVEVMRTNLFVDRLLGVGGIPKKRMIEVVGEPGMGKSSLCLQIIAELQKQGYDCLFVDVEGSYTNSYAKVLGVDTEKLDVLRGTNAEEILQEVREQIEGEKYDLIVLDSIGMLTTRDEHEKAVGEITMAGQSRVMSAFIRKVSPILPTKNVAILCINHTRDNFMTGQQEARGGKSWNYHKAASIRLKTSGNVLKQGEKVIGRKLIAEVWQKNKMYGNVGFKMDVEFFYNEGFSKQSFLLEEAIERGILERRGNTFFFDGEKIGMISALRERLKTDESLSDKIKAKL